MRLECRGGAHIGSLEQQELLSDIIALTAPDPQANDSRALAEVLEGMSTCALMQLKDSKCSILFQPDLNHLEVSDGTVSAS